MPETENDKAFDALAEQYDLMVDWPRRLKREAPFFRSLFDEFAVRSVADVACGTGHHAAMFHSWGLKVEGSDVSAAMIDRCQMLHGEPNGLTWCCRSFTEPSNGTSADAVVCLGNSLALAESKPAAKRAIGAMVGIVRPEGIGVIQVLNRNAIDLNGVAVKRVRRGRIAGRDTLLIKTMHELNGRMATTVLDVDLDSDPVMYHAKTASMQDLGLRDLEAMISVAGGTVLSIYESYSRDAFDESTSGDMILVWQRN